MAHLADAAAIDLEALSLGGRVEAPRVEAPEVDAEVDAGRLYARYGAQVLRWALHLAGPELDGEDIAQEVFFRAHCRRRAFRGQVHVCTWLYGLTANVVAARRRKELGWLRCRGLVATPEAVAEATPLEEMEQSQQRQMVYQVLNSMRERDRTLLIAFSIEGLSGNQVADLFGVKVTTIWTWLNRARLDFRRRLVNRGLVPGA